MVPTHYNKEIRKAKQSSWKDYCRVIEDVPDRARLMSIMASRFDSRVGPIKLPDGQYTQTGKQTLRELYIIHIPGSIGVEVTSDRGSQT
jgi:hypothetical protein